MSQSYLETFAVSGMDSQTAVAVQSLLESQTVPDAPALDEDDVFQCGKCKKQFSSLANFMSHKQNQCLQIKQAPAQQLPSNSVATLQLPSNSSAPLQHFVAPSVSMSTTSLLQSSSKTNHILQNALPTYNAAVASSGLGHLSQNMVVTEDLMSFNIDQSMGNNSLPLGSAIQPSGSFLSPVATFTSRSPNGGSISIISPINTSVQQPSPAMFNTGAVHSSQVQFAIPSQSSCSTVSAGEKPIAPNMNNIVKPSPTKAGRKSAQASLVTVVSSNNAARVKRGKDNNFVMDEKKKLRCTYCDKAFSKNFDLQQHIRAHTGEKPFQCIVCGRAFAQKSNVKKHMATHKVWPSGSGSSLPTQPPPIVINAISTSQSEGPKPEEMRPKEVPMGENTCTSGPDSVIHGDQITENDKTRQQVMSEDKGGSRTTKVMVDNSYLCQYCPSKFKSYFHLKSHMLQHKSEQVYKCVLKECKQTFKELDSFLEHIKTHEDQMTYRCHQCNKVFSTLYELGMHQYTHSLYPNQGIKPGPRHYQCTKCMNKYSTPEALEHHLTTSSHKHPCPHCKKEFTCERYLRRHLPSHGSEGQFQCGTCHKKFKAEHYLKMHMLIHSGETPFACELCNACFNRKDKLKRHMLIHESYKKYKCPFKSVTGCNKEFSRPDKLKSHIITHSGIKPYKCKECDRAFGRKPHLREHERGHRAEYRFKCESCGKGFNRPKVFHMHKCQPNRGGNSLFRPKHKRKVGRPRKHPERNDLSVSVASAERQARVMPEEVEIMHEMTVPNHGEEEVDREVRGPRGEIMTKGGNKKPDFCVKVSTPSLAQIQHQQHSHHQQQQQQQPRFVTVHITNSAGNELQAQVMPQTSGAQILSPQGNSIPITLIETNMCLPMQGMEPGGDNLTMQMIGHGGSIPGVMSELVPVTVMQGEGGDNMVTTQVVVSGADEQSFITCAPLEVYATGDGDTVLHTSEGYMKADLMQQT